MDLEAILVRMAQAEDRREARQQRPNVQVERPWQSSQHTVTALTRRDAELEAFDQASKGQQWKYAKEFMSVIESSKGVWQVAIRIRPKSSGWGAK